MRNVFKVFLLFLATCIFLAPSAHAAGEVNVYTSRHYDIDKAIYDAFTEKTGIKVNVISGKAPEILARLKSEGADSPADIFMTVDMVNLYNAIVADMVTPIHSAILDENIPASLRGTNNAWVALTQRARGIGYEKGKFDFSTIKTYQDLAKADFKGKILVRSAASGYNQSLIAGIIAESSEAKALDFVKGLVKNMARTPKGNDRDQIKAVIAGEGDIAILNTYYLGRMMYSDDPKEVEVAKKVAFFFPENTHVDVSAAAIMKHGKNKENATKLLEYLTSPEVQSVYANKNYETPANPKVAAHPLIQELGTFTRMNVNLEEIGKNTTKASMIMGQGGWK